MINLQPSNITKMNWIPLNTIAQLDEFLASDNTVIIFKHSTRCSVSAMAKRSLAFDKDLIPDHASFYYLDIIAHREVSNSIADLWDVKHESPQILVIKGKECLYNASHSDIEMQDIVRFI